MRFNRSLLTMIVLTSLSIFLAACAQDPVPTSEMDFGLDIPLSITSDGSEGPAIPGMGADLSGAAGANSDGASISATLLLLINQARCDAGYPPVVVNNVLIAAASLHSSDMAREDLLSHFVPGSKALELEDRMLYVGYQYKWVAENIAELNGSTEDVFNAWMNSEYHRINMLTSDLAEFGAGSAVSRSGTTYWALVIGVQQGQSAPLAGATCP
jgi:uncharacterized protein YkwD